MLHREKRENSVIAIEQGRYTVINLCCFASLREKYTSYIGLHLYNYFTNGSAAFNLQMRRGHVIKSKRFGNNGFNEPGL
jgi:hypothetical protein